MDKKHILGEINRTARENGGRPLGENAFARQTGIARSKWFGIFWRKWSEAVAEAGYTPNALNRKIDDDVLAEYLIAIIRGVGRFPTEADIRLAHTENRSAPSINPYKRIGRKGELAAWLREWCASHSDSSAYDDIVDVCVPLIAPESSGVRGGESFGFVYLVRHGTRREYKIGCTDNILRREGEISLQMPQQVTPIHVIKTDDPSGVEAYWHKRFADKRLRGEWFSLGPQDIRAFKRWKRLY